MTKADVVKSTYNRHFEDLEKMKKHVEAMKAVVASVTGAQKAVLDKHVTDLEAQIEDYAKELYEGGIDIIKRVA